MAEEDILSEDELNDLAGKEQEGQEGLKQEELYQNGQVLPYDFKQPEHTKHSQFPTLQLINEKTAIELREVLEVMLQMKVEVKAQDAYINKFGEFVHSLSIPIDIKTIDVPELKGSFYICFDNGIIDSMIEGYFGAPEMEFEKSTKKNEDKEAEDELEEQSKVEEIIEKEEFTKAESRISQKLLTYVINSMHVGWRILDEYNFIYEKTETNPRLINDLDHDELLVNMNFEVKIRDKVNIIRIGVPYKTLDKVKHQLRRVVQNIQEASDKQWLMKLYEKSQAVPLELIGELGRVVIPVNKLVELKVGDILNIQKPESITIYVDKTPILSGQLGESNGQTAIQINEWIRPEVKK